MDYKELIEKLNGYFDGKELKRKDALNAATAIETLLAERDEAIRMLHGKCSACKYENRWRDEPPCCHCIFARGKYDNWEWCDITHTEATP